MGVGGKMNHHSKDRQPKGPLQTANTGHSQEFGTGLNWERLHSEELGKVSLPLQYVNDKNKKRKAFENMLLDQRCFQN